MKTTFFILSFVFALNLLNAQISLPKSLSITSNGDQPTYYDVLQNYNTIKSSSDSADYKEQKRADRWMYGNKPYITVNSDSTFDTKAYTAALKALSTSNLYCKNDEFSNWTSTGPNLPDTSNGLVSAIAEIPELNNRLLIGTDRGGIFMRKTPSDVWVCVTDQLPYPILGIRDLLVDPNNFFHIIAATGTVSGLQEEQNAVLHSFDGGNSWTLGNEWTIDGQPMKKIRNLDYSPNHSNLLFGIGDQNIYVSSDDGISWRNLNLPNDIIAFHYFKNLTVTGADLILISAENEYGISEQSWKGTFDFQNPNFTIDWGTQNQIEFLNMADITSQVIYISQTAPSLYIDNPTRFDCTTNGFPNQNHPLQTIGDWSRCITSGWDLVLYNGSFKATCFRDVNNPNRDVAEVRRQRLQCNDGLLLNPDRVLDIRFAIPKGMKLKVYYSEYNNYSYNVLQSGTPPNAITNLTPFDYPALFSNLIYETPTMLTDTYIDEVTNFNLSAAATSLDPDNSGNQSHQQNLYYYIETDESIYENGVFRMDYLAINDNPTNPEITVDKIFFSDNVNNTVYAVSVRSGIKRFWKSIDNGVTFQYLNSSSVVPSELDYELDLVGPDKVGFKISPNNSNVFYFGSVYYLYRIETSNTEFISCTKVTDGNDHPDIRSVFIHSNDGRDDVYLGLDGGIFLTENALTNTTISCLNNNLKIHLIYQMDIHENSKKALIGLQDNNTHAFNTQTNLYEGFVDGGDGSLTYIHPNNSTHYFSGDPQSFGDAAFGEQGGDIMTDMSGVVFKGDAFLGMNLESYRHDPDRFAVGFRESSNSPVTYYILNKAPQVTEKILMPEMTRIQRIGICQKDINVLYFGEGDEFDITNKLVRTDDQGQSHVMLGNSIVNLAGESPITLDALMGNRTVTSLAVKPTNSSEVLLAMSGIPMVDNTPRDEYIRILRSTDKGVTFTDFSKGLPALPVKKILYVESAINLIFCANDGGVYYRHDGMDKWECFSNNLPKASNTDLVFDYCSKELHLATYGRGTWKTAVPFFVGSDLGEEITVNTTWNTPKTLLESVIVKAGRTLTIENTDIAIKADLKIIIEPGAKLNIIGSRLSNTCGGLWHGIEVWGHSNLSQTPSNQGFLYINNSTIENTREAVSVWKPNDWNSTGGIVIASSSIFKNNRRSVSYLPYHTYAANGNEIMNKGRFTDCSFIWDDDFNTSATLSPAMTLYHVNGVIVSGCTFEEQRTVFNSPRHSGVYNLDARTTFKGRPLMFNPPVHDYFDAGNYDICEFKNLSRGIEAANSATQSIVQIDHCRFTDNFYGIVLKQTDNAVVTRNRFEQISVFSAFKPIIQLTLEKSTGYKVEGNVFSSTNATARVIGSYVSNGGLQNNEIYRNQYTNLLYANYGAYQNQNGFSNNLAKGLVFKCNQNANANGTDEQSHLANQTDITQGIRLKQGLTSEPARNTFTNVPPGNPNQVKHVWSLDNDNLIYYAYNVSNQIPTQNSASVGISVNNNIPQTCSSSFTTVGIGHGAQLNATEKSVQLQLFQNIEAEYTTKLAAYTALVAGGNSGSLLQQVNTMTIDNKHEVRTAVEAKSPYVSETILRALGTKEENLVPAGWYKNLILANIEVAQDAAFMEWLGSKENPLPPGHLQQIEVARLSTFTDLTVKTDELIALGEQLSKTSTVLAQNAVVDTTEANWNEYITWVTNRNDVLYHAQLADAYLGKADLSASVTQLTALDQQATQQSLSVVQKEMRDYTSFKRFLLSITENTGVVRQLTANQIQDLEKIRDSYTGISAVQAGNILCFHAGICKDIDVPVELRLAETTESEIISSEEELANTSLLHIVPNPNDGVFELRMNDHCAITTIAVVDALGKPVETNSRLLHNAAVQLTLAKPHSGVYLVTVQCADGRTLQARLIVH